MSRNFNHAKVSTQEPVIRRSSSRSNSRNSQSIEAKPAQRKQAPHRSTIVFPTRLRVHNEFPSIQSILNKINQEASERKIKTIEYRVFDMENVEKEKGILLKCSRCCSQLTFVKLGSKFRLKIINNIHHPKHLVKIKEEEANLPSIISISTDDHKKIDKKTKPIDSKKDPNDETDQSTDANKSTFEELPEALEESRKGIVKAEYVHPRTMKQLSSEDSHPWMEEHSNLTNIEGWLSQNGYVVHRSQKTNQGSSLLAISSIMKSHYLTHCRGVLQFTVFRDYLEVNEQLGLFYVQEEGALWVVGLAVISNCTNAKAIRHHFKFVIKQFFTVHDCRDQYATIMTGRELCLPGIISQLNSEKVTSCTHAFNSQEVVHSVCRDQKASNNSILNTIQTVLHAAETRDSHEFKSLTTKLSNDERYSTVFQKLMNDTPSVFYLESGKVFTGLRYRSFQQLTLLLQGVKKKGSSSHSFFRTLHHSFKESFALNVPKVLSEVELQFGHHEIAPLLKMFAKIAVVRFVENYLIALRQYLLATVKIQDGVQVFAVESFINGSRYLVRNGLCKCLEMERTGVACPHLIITAISECTGYKNLIDKVWLKQKPHRN